MKPSEFIKKLSSLHGKLTWKKSLALLLVFFRIGLFTFGGGYAMLPLIQKEIIEKKKWLTEIELMDILVIAESTPGPVSVNTATYVGYRLGGVLGSIVSTLSLILPSFIIIFIISLFFDQFIAISWVQHAFQGIQAAVAVLIISAALKLFKKLPKTAVTILISAFTAILLMAIRIVGIDFSSVYFIILGFGFSFTLAGMSLYRELEEKYIKVDRDLESLK